ncbi:MAG: hypothetical protein KBC91_01470 [Candidatus Omnitrophica bacterium]|nr:hypothetical protein [Candidatus Omnitrophota bacterium]
MDMARAAGLDPGQKNAFSDKNKLIQYINLKLAALNQPICGKSDDLIEIARPLLRNHQEKNRLLFHHLCPVDRRIQAFLDDYLKHVPQWDKTRLPAQTFTLDFYGLARMISLPASSDLFTSDIVTSYRLKQGVLHNPKNDRRTTQGVFHITEGGLPIPDDKKAVPPAVFAGLLHQALNPPKALLRLPFSADQENQAELFVSLLLRPIVVPEVKDVMRRKSMEIRFFAPGNLVGNLDFVESIFGNAGDPYLPENDAALDVLHWTGHTGCVILAPHLITLTKKELGLPHYDQASDRQRRDGMCWKSPEELYNGGDAFKVTCRDERGVMVTIIADNYFGYCKKEVKTQISYAANLFGLAEEEHSGGAIAFPSYVLGETFYYEDKLPQNGLSFDEMTQKYASVMELKPEGYAVDKKFPNIIYVPSDARLSVKNEKVTWTYRNAERSIKLLPWQIYVYPSGYKVEMQKHGGSGIWRLTGTVPEGTLCHKPSTVSGGGKSEISKSIEYAIIHGPVFVSDFYRDLDTVDQILAHDYSERFVKKFPQKRASRPILSDDRSLGSVIKLLTPSPEYIDSYNAWLGSLAPHIREMVFILKRYYKPEWGSDWRSHFTVDTINGTLGHELKYNDRKLVANYLRVGEEKDGVWRTFKLRQDFNAAAKIQAEDDITASVVLPAARLTNLNPEYHQSYVKLVANCEYRLFQRPDDAIHRGFDKQAEKDICSSDTFLSNWQPLTLEDARDLVEDATGIDQYSAAMGDFIRAIEKDNKPAYFVSSAHPRLVDGKPSKNPRYLQDRPDLVNPQDTYLAEMGVRLFRKIPAGEPVYFPVNAVLSGRRNNPPDAAGGIRPLAVYNPIHYQELPELFIDFVASVTGKSPSTTGAGSEGALTKGPFNALLPVTDLNNALVSFILTGDAGFSSAAGYVGPNIRVDHDVSLLIPEIWCRMTVAERDPEFLIKNGYLEKLEDFDYKGTRVLASRLGFRITMRFVYAFFGRMFNNPNAVFSEAMLRPEQQSMDIFVDGVENIVSAGKTAAEAYFADGSVDLAIPPLKALLHIMARGHYEGKDLQHPEIRGLFTLESLLRAPWYQERLQAKQRADEQLWARHIKYLEDFIQKPSHVESIADLGIRQRLSLAHKELTRVQAKDYLDWLQGTLGLDPAVVRSRIEISEVAAKHS